MLPQSSAARPALMPKPTLPINPAMKKPMPPTPKRKREVADVDESVSKKQKVTDIKEAGAKQPRSKPATSTVHSRQIKEAKAAIRKPLPTPPPSVVGVPLNHIDNEDGTKTMVNTYNGKTSTYKPKVGSYKSSSKVLIW